jgi:hypothetical protein
MDLFEHYDFIPKNVQDIMAKFGDFEETYDNCAKLKAELNQVGYDCDYYLDAIPYDLHKIRKGYIRQFCNTCNDNTYHQELPKITEYNCIVCGTLNEPAYPPASQTYGATQ